MLSKEAQDFKSFRTLKRRMLLEKRRALMWQFTPSPEPEDPTRKRIVEENEAALSKMKAEWEQRHAKHHQENEEEDDAVCSADEEEADLFRKFIEGHREELMEIKKAAEVEEPQEDVVGPTLPGTAGDTGGGAGGYGLYLRPGEGQAMASYVQSGKRIPRRGEVGLDADSIAKYEAAGYVMSGNRHARMNAIRIRKENQVYTAEEKAALAMINFEEKKAKEEQVLADLKALVDEKLGEAQG
ncbi:unnamed protein product [Pedinophyceae sp. YPF-701]|nr:unnamed protein product [Pedinophyceae sp. YPF-701]